MLKKIEKNVNRCMAAAVAVFIIAGVYFIFFRVRPYALDYSIRPYSAAQDALKVDLTIRNLRGHGILDLYAADVKYADAICYGADSRRISFQEKDGLIEIDCRSENSIRFTYDVKLGDLGKHGHSGELYSDLLTFNGEEALIFPREAFSTSEGDVGKSLGKLSIHYDMPAGWIYAVPFPSASGAGGNAVCTQLSHPSWADIYDLGKSCYAFGKFKQYEIKKGAGKLSIYIDPEDDFIFGSEACKGIDSLYSYYKQLFGYDLNGFSIVLLRRDAGDGQYLMGGSSAETLGSTFNPEDARDWQLMGHRFFHAFFETGVRNPFMHQAPQLWLYEGLATYYENMSAGSLPPSIRNKTGIDAKESFLTLFEQYIYMRYKDKYLFTLTPMEEENYESHQGITEFLHYTQAPLTVKAVDDIGYSEYGDHDRILKYILANRGNKNLNLKDILSYALGDSTAAFANRYLYGNQLLPMWYLAGNEKEDDDKAIASLNDIEHTLWTWLRLEDTSYPLDKISGRGLHELAMEAAKEGVHFTASDIEDEIKSVSPTVYEALEEYAYRAKVCGVDQDDELLRYKLLGDKSNLMKWAHIIDGLK